MSTFLPDSQLNFEFENPLGENENAPSERSLGRSDTAQSATHAARTSYHFPNIMTLNIGGRKFRTLRMTLENESAFFKAHLSGSWTWLSDEDGAYFVDSDPDLFEHLLRFMRRPNVFPLFWTPQQGFDYNLYNQLQLEAHYFQIDTLANWIKNKMYLGAVTVVSEAPAAAEMGGIRGETTKANEEIERHIVPRSRKVYLCPRGVPVHKGAPEMCGRQCERVRGSDPYDYEDENYLDVVVVKKTVTFDHTVCRG
ncbi:hypothetical protein P154DRAFT_424861 [Amniculicola lignicola CBS 123094]|uniref:BTB domain-containing protein n=1 Tax=Amniculicola lignicola CBS 123094 TaxID=1392246 RepID=A0A6A5WY09_9PLEO|nr:hypothetical protein P154DRAFT_424861 [Amniculicola lignicola CBS 123094]